MTTTRKIIKLHPDFDATQKKPDPGFIGVKRPGQVKKEKGQPGWRRLRTVSDQDKVTTSSAVTSTS